MAIHITEEENLCDVQNTNASLYCK